MHIFPNCLLPVLSSQTGLLVSSERRHVADRTIHIDPDRSSLQFFGQFDRPSNTLCPNTSSKAEYHVVTNRDSLFFVLEGNDGKHRAKNFLLCNSHTIVDIGINCRLHKPAFATFGARRFIAAKNTIDPFIMGDLQIAQYLFVLWIGRDWPNLSIFRHRITHSCRLGQSDQFFYNFIVDRFLDQKPGSSDTGLPRGSKNSRYSPLDRIIDVAVIKNDVWRFATQLQTHFL